MRRHLATALRLCLGLGLGIAGLALLAGPAHAVEISAPVTPSAAKLPPENGPYSVGPPRWFVSTKSDLGIGYAKPYFSFGYGMPHWIWAGIDLSAVTTYEMAQPYAGIRGATPVFDLAVGLRHTWSFTRPLLDPDDKYSEAEVERAGGDSAKYWAWEVEVVGILPLPHSALIGNLAAVGFLDTPSEKYVYDESYRTIIASTTYSVLRLGAVARLLNRKALKLGVIADYVFQNGREKNVVRAGPVFALSLTDHTEVLGVLTSVIESPDALGFFLGSYGVLGLRYRWATGESDPELPWAGPLIP